MTQEFENKLRTIIKECIHSELSLNEINILNENSLQEYLNKNYKDSLNEMARINTKEFYGYFPFNKFRLVVWSNDHNPPHFHVIAENWDIVVNIEDGTIIKVKQEGNNSKVYSHVEKYVNEWLNSPSAIESEHTNREIAMLAWKLNNNF